jgi:GNAT superfamily N-acetyltransferase
MAELRAMVLRSDLERLGRFDEERVRTRFLGAFVPACTRAIVVDSEDVGLVAVRPDGESIWIEHFYLHPEHHGRGVGSSVLATILTEAAESDRVVRLNVLQGSPAQRLYERFGFVVESADGVDIFMRRASSKRVSADRL